MDAPALLTAARAIIGGAIAAGGICALAAGAIGVLRFPDVYTRLHAAHAGQFIGAPLVLLGLLVLSPHIDVAVRLLLLAGLVVVMAPVMTHVVASAAHAAGLAPITGKYTAPRPGARRP